MAKRKRLAPLFGPDRPIRHVKDNQHNFFISSQRLNLIDKELIFYFNPGNNVKPIELFRIIDDSLWGEFKKDLKERIIKCLKKEYEKEIEHYNLIFN